MGYYKDLSYLTSKDGKRIKDKYLIKASRVSKWKLHQLGVKKIVDLRSYGEVKKSPERPGKTIEYKNIPLFDDKLAGLPNEDTGIFEQMSNLKTIEETYKLMVTNEEYTSNLSKIIKEIINSEEFPVMYHCTEGKDRTGITTFILLKILGFDNETIMNDYLVMSKYKKAKSILCYIALVYFKRNIVLADKIRKYLMVDEKYLNCAIEAIEETYGSIDNFIELSLDISNKEKEDFKNKVLVK